MSCVVCRFVCVVSTIRCIFVCGVLCNAFFVVCVCVFIYYIYMYRLGRLFHGFVFVVGGVCVSFLVYFADCFFLDCCCLGVLLLYIYICIYIDLVGGMCCLFVFGGMFAVDCFCCSFACVCCLVFCRLMCFDLILCC